MKTPVKIMTAILLAAGIFIAGYMANRHADPSAASASTKQVPSYTCPMHPHYQSDHAGDCPICGMRLEPANAGEATANSDADAHDHAGLVQISTNKQQLIGVRTDEVKQEADSHVLRVPGRITVDDQRQYRILAATDGWIVELGQNTVGRFVKKDQELASYYTRELLSAERMFLLSIPANEPLQSRDFSQASIRTAGSANPQFPIDSLHGLGMSDIQIEELQKTRTSMPHVHIYSPVSGFVVSRNISPNQRFQKGEDLYRIADIGHVWVMTDLFERDRQFVKPGATATIRYLGREFQARLSDALPQLDPQTRTLKTRFELDNPGNVLLPDAFVDVELTLDTPAAVTVPAEAVIDSGLRKTVYVERGNGTFEPRLVQTGWRMGDRVQIVAGLEPGERIVVSSNFLIDSESRMKMPATPVAMAEKHEAMEMHEKHGAVKDLICGMDVDPNSPHTLKAQHDGKTYYFCSDSCKKNFEANPGQYAQQEMAAPGAKGKRATS
jgi:Cu(I)/Ag(I) efflux system membrane fusion protein